MDVVIDANVNQPPIHWIPVEHHHDFYLNMLYALGYSMANAPLASLLSAKQGLQGETMVVAPIYWEASHNDATIVAYGHSLGFDEARMKSYFDALAAYFLADGVALHYHAPYYWLMTVEKDNLAHLNAPCVMAMAQQSLLAVLPTLDKSHHWSKCLTEIQMLFMAFNKGEPGVNGVWIWPDSAYDKPPIKRVLVDSPLLWTWLKAQGFIVTLFDETIKTLNVDVVILSNVEQGNHPVIKKYLDQKATRWLWNDFAYQRASKRRWWHIGRKYANKTT